MDPTESDCALRATELDIDIRRAGTSRNEIRQMTFRERGDVRFGFLSGCWSWESFSQNRANHIERGECMEQNARST